MRQLSLQEILLTSGGLLSEAIVYVCGDMNLYFWGYSGASALSLPAVYMGFQSYVNGAGTFTSYGVTGGIMGFGALVGGAMASSICSVIL